MFGCNRVYVKYFFARCGMLFEGWEKGRMKVLMWRLWRIMNNYFFEVACLKLLVNSKIKLSVHVPISSPISYNEKTDGVGGGHSQIVSNAR